MTEFEPALDSQQDAGLTSADFAHIATPLKQALTKRQYATLTPVQTAVIEPGLENADMLVSAQTGSGKTVAFGLALASTLLDGADRFARADQPVALAIAPTRELALQVKRELEWLYELTGAKIASCVGGMDMRTERRNLAQGAHIVVGTPGRLCDHIKRGSLDMTGMKAIVLDEADEMLDLGFRDDLEFILEAAPAERRTLMFSATVPRTIANLAKRYQRDAVRITTTSDQKQHLDIEYRAFTIAASDRENAIINVLRFYEAKNAIVFCNTRATVNHMTARLTNRGFSVVALSGELSQGQRTHALQAMRDGRARVCIATDVAARGIDLPNLELVIHADLPKNREGLLHRSGRTGRAGRKGVSALIVPHKARRRTERLLDNAGIKADWARPPSATDVLARDNQRILQDPIFTDPINPDEQEFISELITTHQPEQIAVALLRLYRSNHSAPEELLDAPQSHDRPEKGSRQPRREDFANGVWFAISVGRKDNAEPRWLLPMLCRAGGISKAEIGAIRIEQNESHVEVAPEAVDGFLAAIGPDKKIEKNVSIQRLDKKPQSTHKGRDRKPQRQKSARRKPSRNRDYTPEPDKSPNQSASDPEFDYVKRSIDKLGKSKKPRSGKKTANTPLKSKLSPAQKKRKKLKKQLRKQGKL